MYSSVSLIIVIKHIPIIDSALWLQNDELKLFQKLRGYYRPLKKRLVSEGWLDKV